MNRNRSIIYSIPIQDFSIILDRIGLDRTWYSIIATHIITENRDDLKYILEEKEFCGIEILKLDFIAGLSIGEISVLYEYSLAYVDGKKRKQEGQYFTPDDIAKVMSDKTRSFPNEKIWLDPCSGVGNLSYWLIKSRKNREQFLCNNIILLDRDPLALFIAKCIFTIDFQKHEKRLFRKIASRFVVADFLYDDIPKHDYAILNPPYVVVKQNERFETYAARDIYAYFLERVIKSSAGFVSISPQTFTNSKKFLSLRRLLINNFSEIDVYCFDNVPDNIFRGIKFGSKNTNTVNSTRAGIIVAKPSDGKRIFRITQLMRWRVKDRQRFLNAIDDFLVPIEPTEGAFPKLQGELLELYHLALGQDKILAHMLSTKLTSHKLIVPSTPRYFISALKRTVARSSYKTLYFNSADEKDLAYLFLNSSYMYWWWRVNDGGMTLTEKTLHSLPIMKDVCINQSLLSMIERSEQTNLVVKRNAGKDNENVKHDISLVQRLNKYIIPDFADALFSVHNNSVL